MPIIAPATSKELPTLLWASPRKAKAISWSGLWACSRMVSMSHRDWVGCHSSVRPFHTGTPAYAASCSTESWENPRYSMASYIRPRTRAVSFTDSLWPMCEPLGSR